MPRIEVVGLRKDYGGYRALDGVSLAVAPGAFVALIGASGSGKTTLLKSINRLVPPDAGVVRIDGADIEGLPTPALRRRIGYVFQNIGLFPHMSVGENIAIVPRLLRVSAAAREARVAELLGLVALDPAFAVRAPRTLSGGQAARVGLARALAAEPSVMLMDEPFGALDPVTRDDLRRAYRALHDRLGLTTLIVTHDIAEALLLADRVLVLRGGCIVADAIPAQLLANGGDDPETARSIALERARAGAFGAGEIHPEPDHQSAHAEPVEAATFLRSTGHHGGEVDPSTSSG